MSLVTQPVKRFLLALTLMATVLCGGLSVMSTAPVADAGSKVFSGIDTGGDGGTVNVSNNAKDGIFGSMNGLLIVVMGVAGFGVIFCLIFAGLKLAAAQTNPQARTQGFVGLGVACIGAWVVYKCLVIAGWVGGFGG
ncbi:hypothetical protein ACMHYP_23210 [Bacillus cereus]|uniref:hypothetical protein n=1 Tax=Bacillus cereus group TaxID=86661 RepID=UPI0030156BA2